MGSIYKRHIESGNASSPRITRKDTTRVSTSDLVRQAILICRTVEKAQEQHRADVKADAERKQQGIAAGQFATVYDPEARICIGGGEIITED